MNRLAFLFGIFLFSVLLSSCAYWKVLTIPLEEKLLDTWKFEEVLFRKSFSARPIDETSQFRGVTLTFKEDSTLTIHTEFNNADIPGRWNLEKYTETNTSDDHQNGQQYYRLRVKFNDSAGGTTEWLWERFSVTRKGMSGVERKSGGSYSYKLVRNR